MESSKCGHAIAKRSNPNDVFLTPIPLVKQQIAMIQTFKSDVWLDPFFGTGNYYNNFPTDKKDFCEIADPYNKDFFTYKVGEFSSRPDAIFLTTGLGQGGCNLFQSTLLHDQRNLG